MEFTIEESRIYAEDENGRILCELAMPGYSSGISAITHVYVARFLRNQGIASKLMETACDVFRRQGRKAVAICPYAVSWIKKNPEYDDVLSIPESGPKV